MTLWSRAVSQLNDEWYRYLLFSTFAADLHGRICFHIPKICLKGFITFITDDGDPDIGSAINGNFPSAAAGTSYMMREIAGITRLGAAGLHSIEISYIKVATVSFAALAAHNGYLQFRPVGGKNFAIATPGTLQMDGVILHRKPPFVKKKRKKIQSRTCQ